MNSQILFTQNNPGAGVRNGSHGKLVRVKQKGDVLGIVELDTGDSVETAGGSLDALELGYAMTLHKAQGDQFRRVIVLLKAGRVMDRIRVYTALSFDKVEVQIIGSLSVFRKVVDAPLKAFKQKNTAVNASQSNDVNWQESRRSHSG